MLWALFMLIATVLHLPKVGGLIKPFLAAC